MNQQDIKLTVLSTMAEATTSAPERELLLEKVQTLRFEQVMRSRHRRQFLLRAILYVVIGILLSLAFQPLVPFLASHLTERPPIFDRQPTFDLTPFDAPARRHSP